MAKIDLEHHVLMLWTTSRLPIDVVSVRVTSGAAKELVEKTLDKMTIEGTLDMHTSNEGALSWTVIGTPRSTTGPETVAQWHMLDRVSRDVAKQTSRADNTALAVPERKSILLSTALSFFFGGFGLLYAAPVPAALGAIIVQVLAVTLLPHHLVTWIYGGVLPLFGIAGGAYAWTHNKTGRRTALRDALTPAKRQLPPRTP